MQIQKIVYEHGTDVIVANRCPEGKYQQYGTEVWEITNSSGAVNGLVYMDYITGYGEPAYSAVYYLYDDGVFQVYQVDYIVDGVELFEFSEMAKAVYDSVYAYGSF